ncbi:EamA-like transporter family protein [compost metagenome]
MGMSLFSTVLPVFMASAAIRRIGASKTALIGTLGPILTIFFGYWLLDEPLTGWQMGGAGLVLAGVMLVSKRPVTAVVQPPPVAAPLGAGGTQ